MTPPTFPGAVAPERTRRFVSGGLSLCLREWGDPAAAPLVLSHGMFDHGRGFDLLAPYLAERFRVIAFDARATGIRTGPTRTPGDATWSTSSTCCARSTSPRISSAIAAAAAW
jgi:pimeloyl-ACP methyl ester carboxylesterase